jgi:DNA-binding XRE family transcriptional regulator
MSTNHLREIRESFLLGKTELARMANLSVDTLSRIEEGKPCRMETKRKILLALGLQISDKNKVFH